MQSVLFTDVTRPISSKSKGKGRHGRRLKLSNWLIDISFDQPNARDRLTPWHPKYSSMI